MTDQNPQPNEESNVASPTPWLSAVSLAAIAGIVAIFVTGHGDSAALAALGAIGTTAAGGVAGLSLPRRQ